MRHRGTPGAGPERAAGRRRWWSPAAVAVLLTCAAAPAAAAPAPPGPRDRCPVCGMFVAKYPDFAAQLELKGGRAAHFDGVKDLMKHWLGLAAPARAEVQAVWVKEYYGLKWIDGRKAFFVAGSDVYGPMGRELIPFAAEAEAREFLKDHRGTRVLRFGEVTAEVLKGLE